ncbi:hypothetical protein FEP65_04407 [Burkholderia multivorans]|nr:hypothetical protein [Burkholderia multivorans]
MVAVPLHGRRERKRVVARQVDRVERRDGRLAFGQRASLVECDHGRALREFERLRVLDQHAVPRGDTGAGHDRGGRREAERARARDDEHGNGVEDRGFRAGAGEQPADERQHRDAEDRRHEHGTDAIDEALDRRLFRLRGFDEADDARERRFGADRGRLDDERAFAVDRAGRDGVAVVLRDGQAFARDQRLVDMRAARHDASVDRQAFARPHADDRADAHLRERHVALDTVVDDARAVGPQRVERADRIGRLTLRARFEPLAEAHERDDDGGRLEIQMARMRGIAQQHPQAQPVCSRRAERDQQVHVAGACLHRMPCGAVEARAEAELDDRCEDELQPAGQHRVDAERRGEHRRDQRRAQHGRRDHEIALAQRFLTLAGVAVGCGGDGGSGGVRVG